MKKKNRKQQGVALLLALGIMSLLLVMALAFVTNAVIARKAAANNSARSQARYFGKSAVNQVLVNILAYQNDHPTLDDFSSLVSKSYAGKNSAVKDSIASGAKPNLLDITIDNNHFTPSTKNQPEWEMVHESITATGVPDETTPIIGRFAYMVLPKSGEISLSESLRGNPNLNYPGGWNKRYGIDMKEFNLSAKIADAAFLDRASQQFRNPVEDHSSDPQKLNEDYSDYDSFFADPYFNTNAADKAWIRKWFSMGGRGEGESYPYDSSATPSSTKIKEGSVYYHRFNLARKDWNTGLGTDKPNTPDAVNRLLGLANNEPMPEFTTDVSVTPAAMRLQFLRMIGSDQAAYPNIETRRRQIAANLLDYSDTDDIPTSDIKPDSWWSTPPTYTGNEKTPYINEVIAVATATASRTDTKDGATGETTTTIDGNVRIDSMTLEVINFNNVSTAPGPLSFRIAGTVTVNVAVGTGSPTATTVPLDENWQTITLAPLTPRYLVGTKVPGAALEIPIKYENTSVTPDGDLQVDVSISSMNIDKIEFQYTNATVDFTRDLKAMTSVMVFSANFTPSDVDPRESWAAFGFSVDDPRENLYPGTQGSVYENWAFVNTSAPTPGPPPTDVTNYGGTTTLGKRNFNCNPAATGDAEGVVEPWEVSTAFVRNAPMTSPLELGAISRAAKWETINLKAADPTFSFPNQYNPDVEIDKSGTSYAQGDGGILDQIKMTPRTYDAPKLNLNVREDTPDGRKIYEALALGVTVANTNAQHPVNGSAITNAVPFGQEMSKLSRSFINRANLLHEVPQYATGFGAVSPANDMEREALFAKTVNLLTTKSQPPTTIQFVVVAQSIKDIGNVNVSKAKEDGTTTTPKMTEIGKFDADGIYPLDEVTGEVKMLVTVERDPVHKKLKVIRTEFVD